MKYDKTYLSIRDKRALRKWIKALRSGNYIQYNCSLWNRDHTKHCCLGVYCEIGLGEPYHFFSGEMPTVPKPEGLMKKCFGSGNPLCDVWEWNDNKEMNFIQIANRLEMLLGMSHLPYSLEELDNLYRRSTQ